MTYQELFAELVARKALIVHCSRTGKADEADGVLLFPHDLIKAIDLCRNHKTELCCSVIWPGHVETFGDVGIVLKPRLTESVTMICVTDGGTHVDPVTGKRVGMGEPFSEKAVADTFANATNYNEWNVEDAEIIGVFVKSRTSLPEVAALIDITQLEGYDSVMGIGTVIGTRYVKFSEIASAFHTLPIFTIEGGEIVDFHGIVASPYV